MRIIISIFICFCLIPASRLEASPWDAPTKDLANKVMLKIYKDIFESKGQFGELDNFGKANLTRNSYGVYSIDYQGEYVDSTNQKRPFAFGLTIIPEEGQVFSGHDHAFSFGFPVLRVKFDGYQIRLLKKKQFDITDLANKYGQDLWYHQQKYMPLQLTLSTVKKEYKTNEPVNFMVTVTNRSPQNWKVQGLSEKTLFFRYDRNIWGAKEASPEKAADGEILLRSGESLSKEFIGSAFQFPENFEIYCSYIMTFKDVKPSSTLKVQVVN